MHTLICGVTLSGKTTLARTLARCADDCGQNVIVFDPVGTNTAGGDWPKRSVLFDNEAEFFAYLARPDVGHAHVFIDEAGDLFNASKRENFWLLTRGRHFGLFVYLIAQRPMMLYPTVRNQCGQAYIFRLAHNDLRMIGQDYGFSNLDKNSLDKGDFLLVTSGASGYSRSNVFQLLQEQ